MFLFDLHHAIYRAGVVILTVNFHKLLCFIFYSRHICFRAFFCSWSTMLYFFSSLHFGVKYEVGVGDVLWKLISLLLSCYTITSEILQMFSIIFKLYLPFLNPFIWIIGGFIHVPLQIGFLHFSYFNLPRD